MIRLLLGLAAVVLFSSCKSNDSPQKQRSQENPHGSPSSYLPPSSLPPPKIIPTVKSTKPPFTFLNCNAEAARPSRFTIQDARQEYCLLNEILFGRKCTISGDQITVDTQTTLPSIFSLSEHFHSPSDFSKPIQNSTIREKLGQLEGLQMYFYSGKPCHFDNEFDLLDLIEAHSLYEAAWKNPDLRQAFQEGRVGCLLRRGLLDHHHHHDHDHADGHHHDDHTHDMIFTPATIKLNHLPADTPVSDCLIVRE